jgi:hypothetical protein
MYGRTLRTAHDIVFLIFDIRTYMYGSAVFITTRFTRLRDKDVGRWRCKKINMKVFVVTSPLECDCEIIGVFPTYEDATKDDPYAIVQKYDIVSPPGAADEVQMSFDVFVLETYDPYEPHKHRTWGIFQNEDDAEHMHEKLRSVGENEATVKRHTVTHTTEACMSSSRPTDGEADRKRIMDFVERGLEDRSKLDLYNKECLEKTNRIMEPMFKECETRMTGMAGMTGIQDMTDIQELRASLVSSTWRNIERPKQGSLPTTVRFTVT